MPQGFPNNPAVNDTALLNGSQYEWDGVAWRKTAASTATADLTDYATIVSLATETTRATAAEGVNATDIATITAAMSTDTERLAAVTALTTAYDAADTTLEGLLTTAIAGKLSTSGGTMTGELHLNDGVKATFGDSNDLEINHDGANSYISDTGTGQLQLQSGNQVTINKTPYEPIAIFTADGACTFYFDNSAKLLTTSGGATVLGTMTATSVNVGSWTVTDTGGELMFNNGTNRMKLDASGNLTVTGDITAFGSV